MVDTSSGRDARLALLMAQNWRDEIEQAVDHVKKRVNRSELDRWFRKQWYKTEARRRRQERQRAREKPTSERLGRC